MDAKELRIGNYVKLGPKVVVVSIVELLNSTNSINELNEDLFKGLPITEDLLIKFGFIYEKGRGYFIEFSASALYIEDLSEIVIAGDFITSISFVHELQNLYFSLSGKELELKESPTESLCKSDGTF